MRISVKNLNNLISEYKKFLINKRIEDIVLVNSRLFLIYFKKENKQLLIDLDNSNPHIGILETNYSQLTLPSEFVAKIMMKGKPLIENVNLVNSDRVIKITTKSIDAFYHENRYFLYIELINAHGNMILTNQNNKILTAFYETSLLAPRPIIRNSTYILPEKKLDNFENENFSIKKYNDELKISFKKSLEKRKNELYKNERKNLEKKIKSLEKKIKKLSESHVEAKKQLEFKEFGNILLTYAGEIKKGDNEYNGIKLDSTLDPYQNAKKYFSKYKKAKRTIETVSKLIIDAKKELEEIQYSYEVFKIGNEKEINSIIKIKQKNKESSHNFPYLINYKKTIYYYGTNATQNDYLTFKMFKNSSRVKWFHIKDSPSIHLIINKENPSNQEISVACQILLIKNNLEAAEIICANRCDITRGDSLGKVNINKYETFRINKIDESIYSILKREKRYHE